MKEIKVVKGVGCRDKAFITEIDCYNCGETEQMEQAIRLARYIYMNATAIFTETFGREWAKIVGLSKDTHTDLAMCGATLLDKDICNACPERFKCWTNK